MSRVPCFLIHRRQASPLSSIGVNQPRCLDYSPQKFSLSLKWKAKISPAMQLECPYLLGQNRSKLSFEWRKTDSMKWIEQTREKKGRHKFPRRTTHIWGLITRRASGQGRAKPFSLKKKSMGGNSGTRERKGEEGRVSKPEILGKITISIRVAITK